MTDPKQHAALIAKSARCNVNDTPVARQCPASPCYVKVKEYQDCLSNGESQCSSLQSACRSACSASTSSSCHGADKEDRNKGREQYCASTTPKELLPETEVVSILRERDRFEAAMSDNPKLQEAAQPLSLSADLASKSIFDGQTIEDEKGKKYEVTIDKNEAGGDTAVAKVQAADNTTKQSHPLTPGYQYQSAAANAQGTPGMPGAAGGASGASGGGATSNFTGPGFSGGNYSSESTSGSSGGNADGGGGDSYGSGAKDFEASTGYGSGSQLNGAASPVAPDPTGKPGSSSGDRFGSGGGGGTRAASAGGSSGGMGFRAGSRTGKTTSGNYGGRQFATEFHRPNGGGSALGPSSFASKAQQQAANGKSKRKKIRQDAGAMDLNRLFAGLSQNSRKRSERSKSTTIAADRSPAQERNSEIGEGIHPVFTSINNLFNSFALGHDGGIEY